LQKVINWYNNYILIYNFFIMQVLEKETKTIYIEKNIDISEWDKNKIISAKNNFIKTWKSYSINEAYNLWLTKLNF